MDKSAQYDTVRDSIDTVPPEADPNEKCRPGSRDSPVTTEGRTLIRDHIIEITSAQANHAGIQHIQGIFRENGHRLYHWVEKRHVPSHNNATERELRPLVIARKLSFGSQSPKGRHTREVLMSVLQTLRKRGRDPAEVLHAALNSLVEDPEKDIAELLFGSSPKQ